MYLFFNCIFLDLVARSFGHFDVDPLKPALAHVETELGLFAPHLQDVRIDEQVVRVVFHRSAGSEGAQFWNIHIIEENLNTNTTGSY